jgi:hypothetical protein
MQSEPDQKLWKRAGKLRVFCVVVLVVSNQSHLTDEKDQCHAEKIQRLHSQGLCTLGMLVLVLVRDE